MTGLPMNAKHKSGILFLKNGDGRFQTLLDALQHRGYAVESVADPAGAAGMLAAGRYRAIIADLSRHDLDGAALLHEAAARSPHSLFICIAGLEHEADAKALVKQGAAAYFIPPFDSQDVVSLIDHAPAHRTPEPPQGFCGIIGSSAAIAPMLDLIRKVADASSTVLITGESGSGKELVARAIHENSRRVREPFVVVHCGAIPESLLESELFGHERGAFTGAYSNKQGLFQSARGGTVFLDEIGEVTPATQVKLLRVLESGVARPVGSVRDDAVDVRVIAATNRDLKDLVRRGNFRGDLFYRLNVFPIHVPPLRERKEDIAVLARFFLGRISRDRDRAIGIEPAAERLLCEYSWPGNIRELENVIERASILCGSGPISQTHLPREIETSAKPASRGLYDLPFKSARLAFRRSYVEQVLDRCNGNVARAARVAGMSRAYFYEILNKTGMKSQQE